jgi:hypothetical protein
MTSYTTFPYVLFDIITRGTHSPDARVVTHPRLCVELIEQFRRVITALLVPEVPRYVSSVAATCAPLQRHHSPSNRT